MRHKTLSKEPFVNLVLFCGYEFPVTIEYPSMARTKPKKEISRRGFLKGTGAALAVAAAPTVEAQNSVTIPSAEAVPRTTIRVTVNGTPRRIEVEDRWTLVEVLRDHFGMTGTKIVCDLVECGACTALPVGTRI